MLLEGSVFFFARGSVSYWSGCAQLHTEDFFIVTEKSSLSLFIDRSDMGIFIPGLELAALLTLLPTTFVHIGRSLRHQVGLFFLMDGLTEPE